ncbi:rod shape-determining protein MreC [Lacticaseibacillus thailandensis]|uniref:Cell shape-determining protein MreC n=1 Tax=Lacticaseibacillus thailandensis DSM 22698 = JCM 13996 TaxID=1423810 RepID=A0A0R2C958_9LACO|nr:rod shape-determining protein MreC [Lacticaseibacillus thailandensis]KRM87914.1 Cell shape-determining protein [Lacticaseibacillus thailandensis DSM 22698 = JCM 13996]
MQKFFSNKRLIILMVSLLVCVGLIAASVSVRNDKNTPPVVQQVGNDVVGITSWVVALPANGISHGLDDVANLFNTYSENERLKSSLDDLAQTKVQNQSLRQENKQLKKELKLKATLTDYSTMSAAVISRSPSDWTNTVVINKGSVAGIRKNMPVMSGSGLVGRIVEVNKTNSKVEMISTNSSTANRFAAEVVRTSGKAVNGVITGYNKARGELVLGQIATNQTIKKGSKVMTSGLGGLTPKGLLIGTVAAVKTDNYGLADKVYIKPAGNLDDMDVVTVIKRTIGG